MNQDNVKQLDALLQNISDLIDISPSRRQKAEDCYRAIGEWLCRDNSSVKKYRPTIYPQGSFLLGTVIKPLTDNEEYDIDLVCELALQKSAITQIGLKTLVGAEIKEYAIAHSMKSEPEEGKRCWTLIYSDDSQFHMDILPALPDSETYKQLLEAKGLPSTWSEFAIAITDTKSKNYKIITSDWQRSNPKGYAEWFKVKMKLIFDKQRRLLAEAAQRKIEDIPEFSVKTPLQRSIQIMKRHREVLFQKLQDDKPISVIISTLAATAYNGEEDIVSALSNIVDKMPRLIERRNGVSWVPNPVNPLENFADKWLSNPKRETYFRLWIDRLRADFGRALRENNIRTMSEVLKPALGEGLVNKAFEQIPQTLLQRMAGLVSSASNAISRFFVPHRQSPKWQMDLQGCVNVSLVVSRSGWRPYSVRSDANPLPKNYSLRFKATTDIPRPFTVYWQVVNTGLEAKTANSLRGEFYDGIVEKGGLERNESTLYTGMHWVECFIINKSGHCVARSGEFVVNIQ